MTVRAQNIVSSEEEPLILVDDQDRQTGSLSKGEAHDGDGILHRAFSVFLFNAQGELLLQQRAAGKRLWPLYWSNSCCSHPRQGEQIDAAASRRLQDELGMTSALQYVYKFTYQARYRDLGSEHELCYVYLGRVAETVQANASEIEALRYISAGELEQEFRDRPEDFTPWFVMEWRRLTRDHAALLEKYCLAAR